MSAQARWNYPTEIRIGAGCVAEIGDACRRHGIERPLVVTDPGFAQLPAMATVLAGIGTAAAVFHDVQQNPTGANIDAGAEVFRSGGHDGVIAVGGGSALDVGKCIALMIGQTRPMWDFEDVGDNWTGADLDGIAPVIAVPTTAGTGSEVGRAGLVVKQDEARKVIIFHPKMLPVAVLADPELTVGLPRLLTVGTGMDALSHSLEAICSPGFHPMGMGIGMEGCRLVFEHLPGVVVDPGNLESRTQMMAAAMMGAVAFQRGLGAMHALSHPIGAMFDTPHGMTNAVVMPYVLQSTAASIKAAMESLGAYCGITGGTGGIIERIVQLRAEFGVPNTLVELGVDPSAVDRIAASAIVDPSAAGNPEPLTIDKAARMFTAACNGRIEDLRDT
jgi:alcohol dehydrogenase class IV